MPDDLAPGEIYTDHVCKLLDAEYDRRKVLEARGDSIIKTSSGIIALIFALAVFISGKDYKFTNHWNSIWFLVGALIGIHQLRRNSDLCSELGTQIQNHRQADAGQNDPRILGSTC
jgi:hypothetical protein